ncbi:MAG: aspartate 1-decarboxylase [Armatimonadota bacterium]|nr:MAG: aspartate 1-decarboxylase [Armatimonadota bacterium]GIV19760.1 MAG: aspartate 1-decarboxylase [Armatimonadota bacterium]
MVLRQVLKSKIHRATITEANVDYIGSITIDADLMERVDLLPGELVHVWNLTNGERFETYAIAGEPGSGVICINGAAALKVSVGQKVIIAAFALTDEPITPRIILVDENNRFVKYL